ncbi:peptidyl-prolyl cis-trans isomerase CWC27 homolog [Anoplophora glabripennis]|uniref:peptidyl-prolyl cis-trans isomerase CWC27 homolog n=1 Tax=Anoplophora glabripennis TaxID=217634 RepID=UPI00087366D2|nr:peptidyl-prolyl cis-trans isomerase CWC27 homolog [Anoplophora glabripennis]
MSNVYILEPQTSGKVLLKTTVGDIDIELWAKETPKTCRNFIQLCLEGYYNDTIFHRVVKGFIVQGGDPNGDGTGGESIYGEPFKDEFHQRLRFSRRGLLAMANSDKDDNGSQFFFTLGPTPELQNKHSLFGKVTGDTLFNMLKLEDGLIEDERPVYPHKILKTEVLHNPFSDIEPRVKDIEVKEKKKKEKKAGVKNFKLLSFGEEAEEDEEESTRENEKYIKKGKSTHDVLDDPKLSSQTEIPSSDKEDEETENPEEQLENIRKKLKTTHKKHNVSSVPVSSKDDDEDLEYYLHKDRDLERKKKMEEIKQEIQSLKKDYHKNKLKKEEIKTQEVKEEEVKSETFKAYKEEYDKYKNKKEQLPKKGSGREKFTLDLLEKFKKKLHSAKEKEPEEREEEKKDDDIDNEETWLSHKLKFQDDNPTLAKDANTKDDDWFEIYDPRNPLNKRRRGENTAKSKK